MATRCLLQDKDGFRSQQELCDFFAKPALRQLPVLPWLPAHLRRDHGWHTGHVRLHPPWLGAAGGAAGARHGQRRQEAGIDVIGALSSDVTYSRALIRVRARARGPLADAELFGRRGQQDAEQLCQGTPLRPTPPFRRRGTPPTCCPAQVCRFAKAVGMGSSSARPRNWLFRHGSPQRHPH